MTADVETLHRQVARAHRFELELADLWRDGRISGELHLGIGEEAVAAGVVAHLRDGDGLAVDHRSTPPFVARGADLVALTLEMLGHQDGLCRGLGGHMHLFDRGRLTASSGIVGAAGPAACGFALAGQRLRPGAVAVAFFGEGALNQGMLLESLNLAVAWRLPVVFVCKANRWAITTRSATVTGGDPLRRARAFGMPARRVNGARVDAVWRAAAAAIARARAGGGPSFILARCPRPTGHFLGDPLLRVLADPAGEGAALAPPLLQALRADGGAPLRVRIRALLRMGRTIAAAAVTRYVRRCEPLRRGRRLLGRETARRIEEQAESEVRAAVRAALVRSRDA